MIFPDIIHFFIVFLLTVRSTAQCFRHPCSHAQVLTGPKHVYSRSCFVVPTTHSLHEHTKAHVRSGTSILGQAPESKHSTRHHLPLVCAWPTWLLTSPKNSLARSVACGLCVAPSCLALLGIDGFNLGSSLDRAPRICTAWGTSVTEHFTRPKGPVCSRRRRDVCDVGLRADTD